MPTTITYTFNAIYSLLRVMSEQPPSKIFILKALQLRALHAMKPSNRISLYSYFLVTTNNDQSIQTQFLFALIIDGWLLHNFVSFDSMYCYCDFSNLFYLLVFDNIRSNNGFVMPSSMTIVDNSIFFLSNVEVNIFVFLENFIGNEGIDRVSHVIVFLHFSHPCHPS
jgi:hypothetical protein